MAGGELFISMERESRHLTGSIPRTGDLGGRSGSAISRREEGTKGPPSGLAQSSRLHLSVFMRPCLVGSPIFYVCDTGRLLLEERSQWARPYSPIPTNVVVPQYDKPSSLSGLLSSRIHTRFCNRVVNSNKDVVISEICWRWATWVNSSFSGHAHYDALGVDREIFITIRGRECWCWKRGIQ